MFPRLVVTIIVSTFVYVTVTEAQDESDASTSTVLHRRKTNYLNYAGKTYYFGTIFKANFFQAVQYCRQQGMQLVTVNSQAENERLGRFTREIGIEPGFFWMSGTKLADKNQWVWLSTGSNLIYSSWDRGEPSGKSPEGVEENCLEARHLGRAVTWNDKRCDGELNFICESVQACSK